MKRAWWLIGIFMIGSLGWWWYRMDAGRRIPEVVRSGVGAECRQLVVVRAMGMNAPGAEVWLLEREAEGGRWRVAEGPWEAVVGRNGAGWGLGEPPLPNPGGYPAKMEGDGRSPAGVFQIPFAFGNSLKGSAAVTLLPWLECTPTLRGVDDAKSKYYNQIVDEDRITDKDWDSAEVMRREDGLYAMGLMIDHNPGGKPGGGSCIFLHIWKGPEQGTAGCTALAAEHVARILAWLDPARSPRLGLGVR